MILFSIYLHIWQKVLSSCSKFLLYFHFNLYLYLFYLCLWFIRCIFLYCNFGLFSTFICSMELSLTMRKVTHGELGNIKVYKLKNISDLWNSMSYNLPIFCKMFHTQLIIYNLLVFETHLRIHITIDFIHFLINFLRFVHSIFLEFRVGLLSFQ